MKNVIKPLTKSVLIPLRLTAANVGIHKKCYKYNMKIVKSLEDYGVLLNGVSETIQNEVKKQKGGLSVCF